MKPLFLQYPPCNTCRKAAQWLKDNNIEVTGRHIAEENPTRAELSGWIARSGLPARKFFNTSGKVYQQNNLKEVVGAASQDQLIELLAGDGMLVKRPLLVTDNFVLVGFNEETWANKLL